MNFNHVDLERQHCAQFQLDRRTCDEMPKTDLQSYALACGVNPYQNKPQLYKQLLKLKTMIETNKGQNDLLAHALRKFYNTCVSIQQDPNQTATNNPEAAWKALTAIELKEIAKSLLINQFSSTQIDRMSKHELVKVLYGLMCGKQIGGGIQLQTQATQTEAKGTHATQTEAQGVQTPLLAQQALQHPQPQPQPQQPLQSHITVSPTFHMPQAQCPPCPPSFQQQPGLEAMAMLRADLDGLRMQNQDLQQQLRACNEQLGLARAKHGRDEDMINQLKTQLRECNDRFQQTQTETKHAATSIVEVKEQTIAELKRDILTKDNVIRMRDARVSELEQLLRDTHNEIERQRGLQYSLDQEYAKTANLQTTNQQLQQDLANERAKQQNNLQTIARLNDQLNKVMQDHRTERVGSERLTAEVVRLRDDNAKLQRSQIATQDAQLLIQTSAEQDRQMRELETALEQKDDDFRRVTNDLRQCQEAFRKQESAQKRREADLLATTKQGLDQAENKVNEIKRNADMKIQDLERKLQKADSDLVQRTQQLRDMDADFKRFRSETDEKHTDSLNKQRQLATEVTRLTRELETATATISDQKNELYMTRQSCDEELRKRNDEIKRLNEVISVGSNADIAMAQQTLNQTVAERDRTIQTLQSQIVIKDKLLQAQNVDLNKLETTLTDAELTKAKLEGKIQVLEEKIRNLQDVLIVGSRQLGKTKRQISKLQSQLKEQESQLKSTCDDCEKQLKQCREDLEKLKDLATNMFNENAELKALVKQLRQQFPQVQELKQILNRLETNMQSGIQAVYDMGFAGFSTMIQGMTDMKSTQMQQAQATAYNIHTTNMVGQAVVAGVNFLSSQMGTAQMDIDTKIETIQQATQPSTMQQTVVSGMFQAAAEYKQQQQQAQFQPQLMYPPQPPKPSIAMVTFSPEPESEGAEPMAVVTEEEEEEPEAETSMAVTTSSPVSAFSPIEETSERKKQKLRFPEPYGPVFEKCWQSLFTKFQPTGNRQQDIETIKRIRQYYIDLFNRCLNSRFAKLPNWRIERIRKFIAKLHATEGKEDEIIAGKRNIMGLAQDYPNVSANECREFAIEINNLLCGNELTYELAPELRTRPNEPYRG